MISNDQLNDLLIDLGRSLLQYVGESWLWASADESEVQAAVERLVAEQRAAVGQLAELIDQRGRTVDPGAYPTDYTSFHYVALDYLLNQLAEQQSVLAERAAASADDATDDPQAGPLLRDVAAQAAAHRDELQKIAAARKSPQPA